jgi:Domain of unknown function (DUF1848).
MIISASRRTDIPAFYSKWLMKRLAEGYAMMPNPRNANRLGRVALSPEVVDCIVFWTKNPKPMLDKIKEIEEMGYAFYFLFSLLPYDKTIETNLPDKLELISTFKELSTMIGAERVIWRYDPILTDAVHTVGWHLEQFENMCEKLHCYTRRCIISFVDVYKGLGADFRVMSEPEMRAIAEGFLKVTARFGLSLATCAEAFEGLEHASCIDKALIEQITGHLIAAKPDLNQRPACRCAQSVDIGAYDTCFNGCRYCYATSNRHHVFTHDENAPMLTGYPRGDEIVTDRTLPPLKGLPVRRL